MEMNHLKQMRMKSHRPGRPSAQGRMIETGTRKTSIRNNVYTVETTAFSFLLETTDDIIPISAGKTTSETSSLFPLSEINSASARPYILHILQLVGDLFNQLE